MTQAAFPPRETVAVCGLRTNRKDGISMQRTLCSVRLQLLQECCQVIFHKRVHGGNLPLLLPFLVF